MLYRTDGKHTDETFVGKELTSTHSQEYINADIDLFGLLRIVIDDEKCLYHLRFSLLSQIGKQKYFFIIANGKHQQTKNNCLPYQILI